MKPNRLTFASSPALRHLLVFLALAGYAHATDQTVSGNLTVTNGLITGTTGTGGGMELRLGGLVIAKGTLVSSPVLASADQGGGTRLLWHPNKAAFRAGVVSNTQWDEANIGAYSTAFGYDTTASGMCSTATGAASALGDYSTAMGATIASGYSSTAMGASNTASGTGSTAMGVETTATGNYSTAMGGGTVAAGYLSTTIGMCTTAAGDYTTALGFYTTASGSASTALGSSTNASGFASTAMGSTTEANAHSSLALGRYNIGGGNSATWVSADPVFEIGIGTAWNDRRNALTVFKNGNMAVYGVVTCARGGDIPMFTGN